MTEPTTPDTLSRAPSGAAPSRNLILTGVLLGLVPAAALVFLRSFNTEAFDLETLPGNITIGLILVSPYLIALYASGMGRAAARAPLLLAATLVSFLTSFSALSGVTLILLPSTVVLGIATAKSLRAPGISPARKAMVSLWGLVATAFIVASFLALFIWDDARSYGSMWTSDIITPLESLIGLGLLATGLLVLAATARYSDNTTLEGAP